MFDLRKQITDALEGATHPAIFCSFGSDSALLLHFAREIRRDLPVYYFGEDLPELARQLVTHDDLTVFSYAPADRYLVPRNDSVALIEEYAINGQRVPMISKVVKGIRGTCAAENSQRTPEFYLPHDVVLWGYRSSDHDELIGATFEREIQMGHTKFIAPLYDLTTDQVLNALDVLGLDYVQDDAAEFCDECLNAVIGDNWDRNAALAGFRSRFNFNH